MPSWEQIFKFFTRWLFIIEYIDIYLLWGWLSHPKFNGRFSKGKSANQIRSDYKETKNLKHAGKGFFDLLLGSSWVGEWGHVFLGSRVYPDFVNVKSVLDTVGSENFGFYFFQNLNLILSRWSGEDPSTGISSILLHPKKKILRGIWSMLLRQSLWIKCRR